MASAGCRGRRFGRFGRCGLSHRPPLHRDAGSLQHYRGLRNGSIQPVRRDRRNPACRIRCPRILRRFFAGPSHRLRRPPDVDVFRRACRSDGTVYGLADLPAGRRDRGLLPILPDLRRDHFHASDHLRHLAFHPLEIKRV